MSGSSIVMALLAGILLGLFFYGGLWFTVRRLAATAHPVLFTVGSFWIRTAIALAGFVVLARQGLVYVAVTMASFLIGRLVVCRFLPERRPAAKCT